MTCVAAPADSLFDGNIMLRYFIGFFGGSGLHPLFREIGFGRKIKLAQVLRGKKKRKYDAQKIATFYEKTI